MTEHSELAALQGRYTITTPLSNQLMLCHWLIARGDQDQVSALQKAHEGIASSAQMSKRTQSGQPSTASALESSASLMIADKCLDSLQRRVPVHTMNTWALDSSVNVRSSSKVIDMGWKWRLGQSLLSTIQTLKTHVRHPDKHVDATINRLRATLNVITSDQVLTDQMFLQAVQGKLCAWSLSGLAPRIKVRCVLHCQANKPANFFGQAACWHSAKDISFFCMLASAQCSKEPWHSALFCRSRNVLTYKHA